MKKKYKHLSLEEREKMAIYQAEGKSYRAIARLLDRDRTTIGRELKRNKKGNDRYLPITATKYAKQRKHESGKKYRLKNDYIRRIVHRCLNLFWTPEQIAGRLKMKSPEHSISHEAIYQYIYCEAPQLIKCLAKKHKRRFQKVKSRKKDKTKIPNRVSILKRPEEVNLRQVFGHWEADSIVSSMSISILNVLYERISRYTIITGLSNKSANLTQRAVKLRLAEFPDYARQSISYDNGTENAMHEQVNKYLGSASYFCEPYHSWEKGGVENTNGLIRRFFPKKTDLAKVPEHQIARVQFLLNNRPRKCLGFKTPAEVFYQQCNNMPARL
jgi:IS30 family transposase